MWYYLPLGRPMARVPPKQKNHSLKSASITPTTPIHMADQSQRIVKWYISLWPWYSDRFTNYGRGICYRASQCEMFVYTTKSQFSGRNLSTWSATNCLEVECHVGSNREWCWTSKDTYFVLKKYFVRRSLKSKFVSETTFSQLWDDYGSLLKVPRPILWI